MCVYVECVDDCVSESVWVTECVCVCLGQGVVVCVCVCVDGGGYGEGCVCMCLCGGGCVCVCVLSFRRPPNRGKIADCASPKTSRRRARAYDTIGDNPRRQDIGWGGRCNRLPVVDPIPIATLISGTLERGGKPSWRRKIGSRAHAPLH